MAAEAKGRRRDVGCPFCGLVCDDLTIESSAGKLRVADGGCWLSRERFEALESVASPMVDGLQVDLSTAVGRTVEILAASRAPVFVVAADVAGTRAVLRLADRLGGVVDHPDSDALFRNLGVLQDSGALSTTLTEMRNRADLVLIIGPDPSHAFPRFFERCIDPRGTLFSKEPLRRALFRLGPAADASSVSSARPAVTQLPCAMDRLPEAIAALAAMLRGRQLPELAIPGAERDCLANLAELLKSARYAVVVWAPALLEMAGSALVAQALLDLARYVSRTTRCSILPLGGSANLYGVNQVCTWQTGYPIRTGFGRGVPEHDPYRYSARRMLQEGEVDALVWISLFGERAPPALVGTPTVLLAPPGASSAQAAAAYIPVGMPGVDHAGQVFRTDTVVALRLPALRPAAVPDLGTVVRSIEAGLPGRTSRQ